MQLLYYDAAVIVVDKPGGLLSVPGRGPDKQDCVINRIRNMFPGCPAHPAVHRLDMYTSGIMILARTREAQRNLAIQFEKKIPQKRYTALLDGIITARQGRITLRFRLDIDNRPYQIFDPLHGKEGTTLWRTIAIEDGRTRVEFRPLSGRTHQLRLHAAHQFGLATPIVGDSLYGNGREGEQMMLHATSLTLNHPLTSQSQTFFSPVPF
jgi:tRNA pseudouridine32 synthase/23S rRNA pseudouridine746 synthase